MFAAFFGLTFSVPEWVETFAKAFLEREVSKQVDRTIDRIGPPPGTGALSRAAGALYQKKQAEIEQLKSALRGKVHVQLADALADISDLDCECRARLETLLESGLDSRIRLLQATS